MTPASCLQSSPPEGLLCPALGVNRSTSPLLRLLRVVLLLWGSSFLSSPSSETSQQFSPYAGRGKRREETHALARERNFHSQVYQRPRAHLHGVVGAAAAAPGEVSSSPPSFSSSVSHYHPTPPAFLVSESSAHATAAAPGEAAHAAAGTAPAGGNGTVVDAGAGGGSRGGTDAIQLDASLEERYSPRSCKYRSLPRSLNSLLEYNGEIHTGDVFGLPASSLLHEQRITFTLPQARQQPHSIEGSDSGAEGGSNSSASEGRRAILSVSVEMHRDSVAEFNYLELYRRRPDEQPPPLMSAAEAAAAADGAGAVHAALRRRQAIAVGRRVEGAGGPRTKIVLTAALSDDEKPEQSSGQAAAGTIFELIFSFRDSLGRLPATEEGSSVHSPLLPCFPVRVDLALVPLERMPLHMPSSCPTASRLPPESSAPLVLQDEPLQLSNPAETPFAFVFSSSAAWPPYSLAVWKQTIDIPRRLHRFVHLFFRLSFRFLTGPMQLLLELFDEKSRPDETAAAPECLLGCLGGTPTFNGQLFDHAMPTGFTYKIWILAGEPMYLDHHSTHCAEFDFEYVVQYEARLTPFEVRPHAWLCRFARLPLAIEQIPEGAAAAAAAGNAAAGVAAARLDRGAAGAGLVRARSVDLKDWFGFPVDEIEEMLHFVDLYIYEPSDVRAAVFKSKLRLRVALLSTSSSSAWSSSRNGEQQQDATAAAADGRVVCSEKKLAGQAGDGDAMLRMHCRLPAGHFRLVLYAEYPLGGIAPCDGFYMHFTLRPLSLLNERYGCKQQTNQQQLPPLLLSPQGPPPLAMPPVSHQVIDLGRVEESTLENFRSFSFKETPPTAASPSAFSPVAAGNFSVQSSSASQIFLHVTLLSDFAAADLTALVRRRDAAADAADDYVLSFSHDFQHLVGPLDAGDYRLELVSLSAQTVDDAVAKEVAEPLCLPFLLDLRLLRRAGDDLHSATWSCSQQVPHLPRYIRGEAGLQMTLDKEFRLPTNGHHTVHLFIPKHSILKLHVHSPHSGEPRLSIAAKDTPQENLANAYEDLFLEADAEGDYLVRMQFPAAAGVRTTQPLCPTVQLHLVLIPRGDVPRCPWARGHQQLDAATLRLKAEEQLKAPALADFFRPRGIAEQKLETEAPVDLWLSPSLREAEFSFSTHTVSTSVRVEIVLHPPWLPARLLLFRKDNGVLRRTPEATAQVVQNRLLLLAPDVSSGDFLVQLKIFDEVDPSTEHLCAHATLHAEIGAADETSLNALRAELLGLPELLPAEPPPTSFNRRGWLSLPDTPVIATSIFRFGKKAPRDPAPTVRLITGAAALSEQSPQGGSDGPAATTGRAAGEIRREEAVDATELTRTSSSNERVAEQRAAAAATATSAAETTLLKVEKPTLLRVVAEPAVLSQDKLQLQLRESSASDVAQQPHLAEEAENALLALLLPGKTYQLQYAASAPFLLTIGISSVEQLRRDMMSAPLVLPSSSSSGGGSSADCLSSMPELSLPTPLPHFFESETFDIRLDPSFLRRKDDIAAVPITLSTACVIYVEAVSNFFLDYVKVAVRVEEGTWIGEQHGQANFLRLLLDPGQHNIRIYRGVAANALHSEDAITQGIDIERCLHFSLKIKAVALTYAGPSTAVEAGQGCFSYGALPLPLDFHSRDGGSAALGGPIDSEGRLLVRSKIVIPEGAGRRSVALDTRGKNVVLKVGIFAEDRSRLLLLQVKDGHSLPLTPAMEWAVADGGYERVFELDGSRRRYGGENSSVFYLDFRVEQSGLVLPSACLVFDLVVQTMPLADKQRMCACSGAGMPQPQLPEDFFPRAAVAAAARQSASHETGLQQHVWSPFSLVTEAAEGFLTEIPFALTEESFVVAEVRYNFFASHIEVDLLDNSSHPAAAHKHGVPLPAFSEAETIAGGELDFVGRGRDPLNVRQWIATQLMPGHYVLRVADDHYAPHFMTAAADGTQRHACYPMEFRFQVYSLVAAVQQQRRTGSSSSGTAVGFAALPAPGLVLGIHPDPSLPVKYGQDLLILLRLSTPPSVPTRRGKAPAAGAAKEQEAAVAAAERSAYLVGESGFKLHASQFVNIDVAADEHQGQKVKQLQQGWKEKAKDDDAGDEAEEEGEGGLVWSFLFPAEQVERLGNKAKFRLEFKTKSAAADYLFTFPEPGVQTPQLWSASNSNGNSGSNRDARKYVEEVEFTFLSPGALQENVPWHGMEGAVLPTWLQQQQQASSTDFSAQNAGVPRREDPRQQQPTRGQEASTVAPAAFQQPPQQQPPPGAPLTPPKVPRASLIVEEDEEEEEEEEDAERHLQQETGKKPPRAVPWERHRQPWETQPERKEGQSWSGKGADGRPHADPYYIEESEFEPTCAEGMRWNDETGDCERAPTADKPPSALLVLLVSAAGVGGLLLVSHYALRRRRKGVSRAEAEGSFAMTRLNSDDYDQLDFLHHRYNSGPVLRRGLNEDEV